MDVNASTSVSLSYSKTSVTASYSQSETTQKDNKTVTSETAVKSSETSEAAKVEISSAKDRQKPYKVDREEVQRLIDESNKQTEAFVKMIQKMLQKQGETSNIAFPNQNQMVTIDEETREWAKKEIADDGYYGVEKTAERLLDFAKAISGGDPSKIETLRKAVTKGFENAAELWSGKRDVSKLPEISQKTYDAVMKGFDDWANESKKSAGEVAAPLA